MSIDFRSDLEDQIDATNGCCRELPPPLTSRMMREANDRNRRLARVDAMSRHDIRLHVPAASRGIALHQHTPVTFELPPHSIPAANHDVRAVSLELVPGELSNTVRNMLRLGEMRRRLYGGIVLVISHRATGT